MTKVSKESVHYSKGMVHSHCGRVFNNDKGYCKHFETKFQGNLYKEGACSIVEGKISPIMWCQEFKKASS